MEGAINSLLAANGVFIACFINKNLMSNNYLGCIVFGMLFILNYYILKREVKK